MDRRLHPGTQVYFEAKVMNRKTRAHSAIGEICDIPEKGISIMLPLLFEPADVVEIETADSVLVGRVAYANAEASLFRTGIEIQNVQLGNSDLSNLLQRTLMESMPTVPGVEEEVHFL